MYNIKELQNSLHKHSIKAIQELQIMKIRLQAELKEQMSATERETLEKDLRRCDNIMDQVLCFECMIEYYQLDREALKFR